MVGQIIQILSFIGYFHLSTCLSSEEPHVCYNKFEYEYNVLQKLVVLEERVKQHEMANNALKTELNDARKTITIMESKLIRAERSFDGSTYIRWGRTVCPKGAILIYDGYAAGGHYTHKGSGSNYLCLPKEPTWGQYIDGFQTADRIYATEYYTADYPNWKHLHYQDVPCAVCRIPRNNILMIPGRNICYKDYILEYSGYLMGGHFNHASSSEYVCVDERPEALDAGNGIKSEKYFYFVEASCGVLKCPPYKNTRELTCVVCSFSPAVKNETQP